MGEALVFGLIGSSALVIGGAIGAYWQVPQQINGVLLAFASGTLISALAFELFPEAVHLGGLWPAGLGLIAGGLTFVVINTARPYIFLPLFTNVLEGQFSEVLMRASA
jgi:ZIP family zinc transporter